MTFAFTDVVGSTAAFAEHGDEFIPALDEVQRLIRRLAEEHGGVVVSTDGDGAFLAFDTADEAVAALCAAQKALRDQPTQPGRPALRIRAGAHTGDAIPIAGDYVALPVHVAARVAAAANAGQVLVSQAVVDQLAPRAGEQVGTYTLKDIPEPVDLWRVAGDATPPRATPARRTNVAAPRTSFVGRQSELELLQSMTETSSLVTIAGPGGLGKTRLVSELALRVAETLAGGGWLVELAPLSDPGHVLGAVADALGIDGSRGVGGVAAEISRRGDMLVVLDNCEHVVDAAAELAVDLLGRRLPIRLVCTSREPLGVPDEVVFRLEPLATADTGLQAGPAEQLFLARADAAGARLGAPDLDVVRRVCQRLDGLPLALELAAARAATMPIGALAETLAAGDVELRRRGGELRQRSLDELVGWSLRLLQPAERDGLLALSVFPGRFSPEMADALLLGCALPSRVTSELVRRSLVDVDGPDYRMLNTVRDVVRRVLDTDPQLTRRVRDALFEWAVRTAEERVGWPDAAAGLHRDSALALEEALAYGLDAEDDRAGPILDTLRIWSCFNGLGSRVRDLAERVVDTPEPSTARAVQLHVAALTVLAGASAVKDTSELSRIERLVTIARGVDDRRVLFRAIGLAAGCYDAAGEHVTAREYHHEKLELVKSGDVPSLLAVSAHGDLGVSYHLAHDYEPAELHYRMGLAAAEQLGNSVDATILLGNLGEVCLDRGDPHAAFEHLHATLRKAAGRRVISATTLGLLAEAAAGIGDITAARAMGAQAEQELAAVSALDGSYQPFLDRLRHVIRSLNS